MCVSEVDDGNCREILNYEADILCLQVSSMLLHLIRSDIHPSLGSR